MRHTCIIAFGILYCCTGGKDQIQINTNSHILYLTYDGLTDPLGQSQIIPYLTGLADKGWKFTVISFEKEKEELILHKNIFWHPLKYHKYPLVLSTLYDINRLRQKAEALVIQNSIKIVHCRGYITSLVGLELKRKYGMKFIFDMRGFWADEKLESGNWNSPIFAPVYKYFKKKEKEFVNNSDRIISLTSAGKNYILNAFSQDDGKLCVIPTCVDLSHFRPSDSTERKLIRKQLEIQKDEFIFIYSGSLGGNYPVNLLMNYYKVLSQGYKKARLLVLSKQNVLMKGYPEVITQNVSRENMPKFLSVGDSGIIFYKKGFSTIGRCPTKYAEYIGCGLDVNYLEPYGDLDSYDSSKAKEYFSLDRGVTEFNNLYKGLYNQPKEAILNTSDLER